MVGSYSSDNSIRNPVALSTAREIRLLYFIGDNASLFIPPVSIMHYDHVSIAERECAEHACLDVYEYVHMYVPFNAQSTSSHYTSLSKDSPAWE